MTVNELFKAMQTFKREGWGDNEVLINGSFTINMIEKPVKQPVVFMTTKESDYDTYSGSN